MTFLKKLLTNLSKIRAVSPETNGSRNNIRFTAVIIIFLAFGAWATSFLKPSISQRLSSSQRLSLGILKAKPLGDSKEKVFPFDNINLEAKAAYVFDVLNDKPLFELNADAQLPLASLAKIMAAIVAIENLPPYLLVSIPPEAILTEGDSGFMVNEKMLVANLGEAMLISSSNDAAAAFELELKNDFDLDFVSLMNQKAEDLGLKQTYFLNSTGLDFSKNIAGAQGSAKDIANLLLYAVKNHPSLMEATRLTSINIESRQFKNTNLIVNEIPGVIAGKTGYSDLAGGNLVIIADKGYGHPVIIVVLGSSFDGRFNDIKNLYNAAVF